MISKWKFGVYIQTFMYQLEGSNFKPFPFFNWTQGKGECITCKKEIRRNHLLPIDCTLRVFHPIVHICKKYQRKQKADHSLTLDIITEADFFHKQIYPPSDVTGVAMITYLCPVD